MEKQSKKIGVNNNLTSELIYRYSSLEDKYGVELSRRANLLKLSEEQFQDFYDLEKKVLSLNSDEKRSNSWAKRCFLSFVIQPEWPNPKELTLSELTSVYDELMHQQTLHCQIRVPVFDSPDYWGEITQRFKKINFSEYQKNVFGVNELINVGKLKWSYHNRQSWTKNTTNLDYFDKNRRLYKF